MERTLGDAALRGADCGWGRGGGHDEMNKVYRIRGTAGGDRINYDGPTKANTAALFVHSQNPAPVSRV